MYNSLVYNGLSLYSFVYKLKYAITFSDTSNNNPHTLKPFQMGQRKAHGKIL